jgi:hypothetical protein
VGRGCRAASATVHHRRLSRFYRPKPLLFHSSRSLIILTRLSGPRSSPSTVEKIWQLREPNPGTLELQGGALTTRPQMRSVRSYIPTATTELEFRPRYQPFILRCLWYFSVPRANAGTLFLKPLPSTFVQFTRSQLSYHLKM